MEVGDSFYDEALDTTLTYVTDDTDAEGRRLLVFEPGDANWTVPLYPEALE